MKDRHILEILDEKGFDAFDDAERRTVEAHAAHCTDCRRATEAARVSAALKEVTACDKLNIAAIGNVVPQLHVHVIARWKTDVAWPKPVWGAAPAKPYDETVRNSLAAALRQALQIEASRG